jgi:hypothetical protein
MQNFLTSHGANFDKGYEGLNLYHLGKICNTLLTC